MSVLELFGKGPRFHEWHKGQCQTCGITTEDNKLCKRPFLGHAVINPRTPQAWIKFGSVTTLSRADNRNPSACTRKWAYEKVHGIKPPEKVWQTTGKDLHKEIKDYLRTGVNSLSRLALSGKYLLPEPGDDLDTEREISGIPQLSDPKLYLAGVPFIGGYDLRHTRGIHKGEEIIHDPDGTCEVIDYKSGKTLDWSLTPEALTTDPQMVGYGEVARLEIPALRYIRLTHINFITGKQAQAVPRSVLLPVSRIAETWESFTPVMQSMQSAAKLANIDDVPANPGPACGSYGGCPHQQYCSAGNNLALMYLAMDKEIETMGILDKAMNKANPDTAAQVAALAAAEAAKRGPVLPVLPNGFIESCKIIDAAGLGWPPVAGELAKGVAMYKGFAPKADQTFPGIGTLGGLEVQTDFAIILELADGLCDRQNDDGSGPMFPGLRERALGLAPAAVLPPDAPKSDPVAFLAAQAAAKAPAVVEALATQHAAQVAAVTTTAVAGLSDAARASIMAEPTGGPFLDPKGRPGTSTDVQQAALDTAAGTPAKRKGRPPGSKNKRVGVSAADATAPGDVIHNNEWPGINLFVDCIEHPDSDSLHPYVDGITAQILQHFASQEPNAVAAIDVRCSASKSLEFGKWKAVVAGCVVEAVKEGRIPAGNYTLYTLGDEVAQVVATALRPVADCFVRGA